MIQQAVAQQSAMPLSVVDRPDDLSVIRDTTCAAAIWQRDATPGFQTWLDALPPEQLPTVRAVLRPEAVRETMVQLCETAGTPDCRERDLLIQDVAALADVFARLMGAAWLRLRLDVIATNACRRFHMDALTARLICTYRGTGTQCGVSQNGEDPSEIFTVATGAPIVLRGTLWDVGKGLLHRSPPIEGSGETRLLLVLDPIDDPRDETPMAQPCVM